jgi:hypothetical protein
LGLRFCEDALFPFSKNSLVFPTGKTPKAGGIGAWAFFLFVIYELMAYAALMRPYQGRL